MVYQRYIKKNGKLYGPYTYHSRKVNGKVVSEYHGKYKNEGSVKKYLSLNKYFLFLFISLFLLILTINFIPNEDVFTNPISGKVISSFDYLKGMIGFIIANNNSDLNPSQDQSENPSEEKVPGDLIENKSSKGQEKATNRTDKIPEHAFGRRGFERGGGTSSRGVSDEVLNEIFNKTQTTTETLFQYDAVIFQPVRWKKIVSLDEPRPIIVKLPKKAKNIKVNSIGKFDRRTKQFERKEISEERIKEREIKETIVKKDNSKQGLIQRIFNRITGRVITTEETQEALEVTIDENASIYEIIYETEAPISIETINQNGKRIIISGPELNYTNILAYTTLNEETSKNKIKLFWIQNNQTSTTIEVNITKYDLNNNSLIDYIEWRVPYLSNQTYDLIIEISWAEHLDENRTFISDITGYVNALDNNWSEPINENEFVRVNFKQFLDSNKDITIYPRGNATSVEVYEVNKTELLATFTNITQNDSNQIFLTELGNNTQDTFDLKILGGYLEFDYIVDPASTYNISFVAPTPANDTTTPNTNVTINVTITNAPDLNQVEFNWNGTNYTMYNDSLVLMFNFDNLSALGENDTFVVDVSKYGNDGTWGNSTTGNINYTTGQYGLGIEFDGVDDIINLTSEINSSNVSLTFSAWVKTSSEKGVIIDEGDSSSGVQLFTTNGGKASFQYKWGPSPLESHSIISSFGINDSSWHFLVGTLNSSDHINLYVDGNFEGTPIIVTRISDEPGEGLSIGHSQNSSSALTDFFNGTIDEVRIWNRSLSATEIQQQYFSNLRKYDTDKWNLYVNQSKNSTDGLDDGTYTYFATAKDEAGNENLTETRYYTVDTTNPTIDFVAPTNDSGVIVSKNYIEVNVTATDDNLDIILIRLYNSTNDLIETNTSSTSPFYINYSGLSNGLYYYNATVNDSAGNTNQTETRNITLDTLFPQIQFVNNTPDNDTTTTNTSVEINVTILNASDLNEVKFNWNGTNYTMYNDSLVLMMNFDNLSALGENDTHVVDMSKYGNNGTVTGAVVNTTDCKYGNCYTFDGAGDYVNVSNFPDLGTSNRPYSFQGWIKTASGETDGNIIHMSALGSGTGWCLPPIALDGGKIRGYSWVGSGVSVHSTTTVSSGQWYYFVNTWDATNGLRIFVNGILENTTSQATYSASGASNFIWLGFTPNGCAGDKGWFNGTIDEVRIWNRSLTAEEVTQQYFSNLRKYDTDKWNLYVNQSKNSTDGLDDGTYTYFSTAKDTVGNENLTDTRTVIVDTTNPLIDYTTGTEANNTNFSRSWIYVNVSVTESNLQNITFRLYNSTSQVNITTYTSEIYEINFTNLLDETYFYNVTIFDKVNNSNSTETRTITLDTTEPNIQFVLPTENSSVVRSRNYIEINVTATDDNLDTITIRLYNSTNDLVETNASTASPFYINYSELSDGLYYYNTTTNDTLGNTNQTETRNITLDTILPNITTVYPNSTGGESYDNASIINVSIVEPNDRVFNITFTNGSAALTEWFVDSTEQIIYENLTQFNWTGNYNQEGNYLILVNVSTVAGNDSQKWNLTVNNTVEPSAPSEEGGGGSLTCTYDWSCTEWYPSICPENGIQERLCVNKGSCTGILGIPSQNRTCIFEGPTEPLFDLFVKIPLTSKIIPKNTDIEINIELINVGKLDQLDVIFKYTVINENNTLITELQETRAIKEKDKFRISLDLPDDLEPGTYKVFVQITYDDGKLAVAEDTFIITSIPLRIGLIIYYLIISIIIVLILLTTLIVYYIIKKRKNSEYLTLLSQVPGTN